MAFTAQGQISKIESPGNMVGVDSNGNSSDDSVIYRGQPWCIANAFDKGMIDAHRERFLPAFKAGQRVIAGYLQTSKIPINIPT